MLRSRDSVFVLLLTLYDLRAHLLALRDAVCEDGIPVMGVHCVGGA